MSQEQMEQKLVARTLVRTSEQVEIAKKIYAAQFGQVDNPVVLAAIIQSVALNFTYIHGKSGL